MRRAALMPPTPGPPRHTYRKPGNPRCALHDPGHSNPHLAPLCVLLRCAWASERRGLNITLVNDTTYHVRAYLPGGGFPFSDEGMGFTLPKSQAPGFLLSLLRTGAAVAGTLRST